MSGFVGHKTNKGGEQMIAIAVKPIHGKKKEDK
jgi:hypothetical protein